MKAVVFDRFSGPEVLEHREVAEPAGVGGQGRGDLQVGVGPRPQPGAAVEGAEHLRVEAPTAELDEALSLAGDHLSLYQLTIEEGTRFFDLHRLGQLVVPDDERAAVPLPVRAVAVDDVHLPQRLAEIERRGHQIADQLLQRGLVARVG